MLAEAVVVQGELAQGELEAQAPLKVQAPVGQFAQVPLAALEARAEPG
ncbi:MAG: hypothetical protein HKN04_03525 [Rhodothermaceae bacterium]|nr:hypothetical protein [Rhodothermaceae bacterium]